MQALTVPANLDALEPIGQYVLEAATQAGLERKAAYRLRLAVDEVVTNIIVHGYNETGLAGDVIMRADLNAEALTIIVEDTAQPFDPRVRPDPANLDRPLEERDIGGLGVFLALKGVDGFDYEYADGYNRNSFVMHRPAQG